MSKVDKEYKRKEQIAEATLLAREVVKNFDKLSDNYNAWADDMARDGDEEGSNDMLLEKAEILEFRDGFAAIEKEIIRAATISEAFSNIEDIVKAITNCRKAFSKIPNLEKLTNKLIATRKDINKARESIRGLRTALRNPKDKEMRRLFGDKNIMDSKIQQRFEKEKAARDLRLREGLVKSTAPVPSNVAAPTTMDASIDAITAMIDAENKKG